MAHGVNPMPAELLIHLVDSTAPISEMQWALDKYAGCPDVGKLFFEIDYDYDHYEDGEPKKCIVAGFSLQNVLKHGGVCAEQAYFACTVGKSIGVPTAYTYGASAEVSHAWVGFLQSDARRAWWNFDSGRYEAYQGVRGSVIDPQTRKNIPDSALALLAESIGTTDNQRRAAVALTDAAIRLAALEEEDYRGNPPPLPSGVVGARTEPRSRLVDSQLALIELALKQNPAYAPAWFAVRDLSRSGRLSLDQKKRWAGVLEKLCGQRYPDFSLEILIAMIQSVDDIKEQNALWNAAFETFKKRHDLAAHIRVSQGRMWEKAGDDAAAGRCYEDVIQRYANAGPFILEALDRAEKLLRAMNKDGMVPELYRRAWTLTVRPDDMSREFASQSNWYRVGSRYARRLEEVGNSRNAQDVWRALGGRPARD